MKKVPTSLERQQLHQQFEQSLRLRESGNVAAAQQLTRQLLQVDPHNAVYLEAYLHCIFTQKPAAGLFWKSKVTQLSKLTSSSTVDEQTLEQTLQTALDWLARFAGRSEFLIELSRVYWLADSEECATCILELGIQAHRKNDTLIREMAIVAAKRGAFDFSLACWQRLPNDDLKRSYIAILQPELSADTKARKEEFISKQEAHNSDSKWLIAAAVWMAENRIFPLAEEWLQQATAVAGGSLDLRDSIEQIRCLQGEHRLKMARELNELDEDEKSASLCEALEAELQRIELDVLTNLVQRNPGDAGSAAALAEKLLRVGNKSAAVEMAQQCLEQSPNEPLAWLVLGEAQQSFRRFEAAAEAYAAGTRLADTSEECTDVYVQLHYREAVLAEAMGNANLAIERLEWLARVQTDYRDAALRLDKLIEKRDKGEFQSTE